MMTLLLRLFGMAAVLLLIPYAQESGSIRGEVRDSHGAVVANATVYAKIMDGRPLGGRIPQTLTDEYGSYRFESLPCGRYSVSAAKEEEGYPEPFIFAGSMKPVEVELCGNSDSAIANLTFVKKAAVLVGTVKDEVTGKGVDAGVEFRWTSDPDGPWSVSSLNAKFRILVRTDTPFFMTVSHTGYEDWKYTKNGVPSAILLASDEKLELNIVLKPKKKSAAEAAPRSEQ